MSGADQFGIEVNFLTGRYVATCYSDRQQGEWPPHPVRLFSALVAAWADADSPDSAERRALEWLESRGAPAIAASAAVPRTVASHFVPVNDEAIIASAWHSKKAKRIYALTDQPEAELRAAPDGAGRSVLRLQQRIAKERDVQKQVSEVGKTSIDSAEKMLPDRRSKQERHFPSVRPDEPRATFLWDGDAPEAVRSALDGLLERVTRLGHSSTLVACRVAPDPPDASHVPDSTGDSLRAVRSGQLAELERLHADHQGNRPRVLPFTAVSYRAVADSTCDEDILQANTTGDWIIFEFAHDSRAFPATRAVDVAKAMRGAVLRHAEEPISAQLSGHDQAGNPVRSPHLAFLPLPYVGYEHADGRLLGIALSTPHSLSDDARRALYRAIGGWERSATSTTYPLRLAFSTGGILRLRRLRSLATNVSLRTDMWFRPSRKWMSATPVALPEHPGRLASGTAQKRTKAWQAAEQAVAAACRHADLPAPTHIEVSLSPLITGARPAGRFPSFSQCGRNDQSIRRQLVHVVVTFEHPVAGPLMLGTGRFFGLGMMRPIPDAATS